MPRKPRRHRWCIERPCLISRLQTVAPLARVLRPRSIAIVGASADPRSFGGFVQGNLERFGYDGALHLVSRSSDQINGRACVKTIADLPEGIDVAVLAIPEAGVCDAVRELGGTPLPRRRAVCQRLCRDRRRTASAPAGWWPTPRALRHRAGGPQLHGLHQLRRGRAADLRAAGRTLPGIAAAPAWPSWRKAASWPPRCATPSSAAVCRSPRPVLHRQRGRPGRGGCRSAYGI